MVFTSNMAHDPPAFSSKGKGAFVILNDIPDANKPNLLRDLKAQLGESKVRIIDSYIMNKPPTCDRLERNLRFLYIHQLLKLADQGYSVTMTTSKLDTPSNREDLLDVFSAVRMNKKQHRLIWVNADRQRTKVNKCQCGQEAGMSTSIAGFTLSCHPRGIHSLRVCRPGDGALP